MGHIQRDAFHRLFLFQFIWVFLGVTLGSSGFALVENFQRVVDSPVFAARFSERKASPLTTPESPETVY